MDLTLLKNYKNISGIYKITNIVNNKIYIGSTEDFYTRIKIHLYLLKNNQHTNNHLQSAWNKYGKENFKFEIINICNKEREKLLSNEQYYLDTLSTNYNILKTAGSTKGRKMSEEAKLKISMSNLGKVRSEEMKIKYSECKKGRVFTQEEKDIFYNIEKRIAISKGHTKNKKIIQYSKEGKVIKIWNNFIELITETKYNKKVVQRCLHNHRATAYKYIWKYEII